MNNPFILWFDSPSLYVILYIVLFFGIILWSYFLHIDYFCIKKIHLYVLRKKIMNINHNKLKNLLDINILLLRYLYFEGFTQLDRLSLREQTYYFNTINKDVSKYKSKNNKKIFQLYSYIYPRVFQKKVDQEDYKKISQKISKLFS